MCRVWLYLESHHFRDIRQCWFSSIHLQFEGLSITTYHLTQCNIPDIELYFTGHTTSKESVNGRINFLAMSIIGWSMSYILYMWYLCKKKKTAFTREDGVWVGTNSTNLRLYWGNLYGVGVWNATIKTCEKNI